MATGNGSRQLRRYNVRSDRGRWLAEIVISDDGFFATVSDHGNYAYAWKHAEMEFRSFLVKLDADYLLGKLCGRRSEYVADSTLEYVKNAIVSHRRYGSFDKDEARKEWDLLAERNDLDAPEDFSAWLSDTSIVDAFEMAAYDYPRDARAFAGTAWPAFAAMLRAELAAESEQAAAEGERL